MVVPVHKEVVAAVWVLSFDTLQRLQMQDVSVTNHILQVSQIKCDILELERSEVGAFAQDSYKDHPVDLGVIDSAAVSKWKMTDGGALDWTVSLAELFKEDDGVTSVSEMDGAIQERQCCCAPWFAYNSTLQLTWTRKIAKYIEQYLYW